LNALLADVIVVIHFGIVSFCVLGGIGILIGAMLNWKWIRNFIFRIIHLGLVLYVACEAVLGIRCPLTDIEYNLRVSAAQESGEHISFVARIIRSIIFYDFPSWVFSMLYVGFGVLIILTFIFIWPHRKVKS